MKVYEEDFKKERSDKEQLSTQKERLKKELRESQATVAGLQSQLKQVNMKGKLFAVAFWSSRVINEAAKYS